jgi:hypothetical protein
MSYRSGAAWPSSALMGFVPSKTIRGLAISFPVVSVKKARVVSKMAILLIIVPKTVNNIIQPVA